MYNSSAVTYGGYSSVGYQTVPQSTIYKAAANIGYGQTSSSSGMISGVCKKTCITIGQCTCK